MSKFTITVNDTQIERFILNMLSLFKNNPEIDFKKEGNNYVITSTTNESNMMLAGKPMTWEELLSEIEQSEKDYANGDFLTTDQLRNEARNW